MPVYKSDNGTWYVLTRYLDWKGERKQKCKRGFETRKEAVGMGGVPFSSRTPPIWI